MTPDLKNFLRFLTLRVPMSIEDILANGLSQPMTFGQIKQHIDGFCREISPFQDKKRLNIYIHIPYCSTLCSFCHCPKVLLQKAQELPDYTQVLIQQIRAFAKAFPGAGAGMLCFGGGTPSLLSAADITRLVDEVEKGFPFQDQKVITFEGTPGSLTKEKLTALKACGASRVSLGVQSLDPTVLKLITRKQTRASVLRCMADIKSAGIPVLNVDLVAGLPGQSVQSFVKDLVAMVRYGADVIHVNPFSDIMASDYAANRQVDVVKLIKARDMMIKEAKQYLEGKGFSRSGLEAYSRCQDGERYQESSYSQNAGSVLGIGAFAKSHLAGEAIFETRPVNGAMGEFQYIGYPITSQYAMAQYVIFQMIDGLDAKDFKRVFGVSLQSVFAKDLERLAADSVIERSDGHYRYQGEWSVRRLMDYFAQTKILFGEEMLGALRKKFAADYDPAEDYGRAKYVLQAAQKSWIANIYYRMGI